MNKSSSLLLAGACAAGLVTGIAGKRLFPGSAAAESGGVEARAVAADSDDAQVAGEDFQDFSRDGKKPGKNAEQPRSIDTVESLLAISDGTLYQRLALWLMDATEEEIAEFWQVYQKEDASQRSRDINDLVFLNWARLNPRGAIAGAGPSGAQYAWWAWACHDPKGSLAAAISVGGDRLKEVAFGLGEFHPDWLREHFKELPEEARQKALAGLVKWDDAQDPLTTLRFMDEHGLDGSAGTIRSLARKDPEQAIDWAMNYRGRTIGMLEFVARTLASERQEELRRLIDGAPSGEAKLKMEAALFGNLVKTDPAAALEQARSTEVPRIAAGRYAALGIVMMKDDSGKALELARDLFTKCPDALDFRNSVDLPDGSTSFQVEIPGMNEFTDQLLVKDPASTLEMVLGLPVKDTRSILGNFSGKWATRDLEAYSAWATQQTDPRIRDVAAHVVSDRLTARGHFEEAAEWAWSGSGAGNDLEQVMSRWKEADADAASRWLESSAISESLREAASKYLDPDK